MGMWSRIGHWWRQIVHGRSGDRELGDELQSWVDLATDERVRAGERRDLARRRALIESGGIEQVKEEVRAARGTAFVDVLRQDIRFGVRQFRRAPGFTLAAVLALGLGIGATASTFAVVDAVLLRPLNYADADRLVLVMHEVTEPVSPRNYLAWRRETTDVFAGLEAAEWWMPNLTGGGDPEKLYGLRMTPGMFSLLGIPPERGRVFSGDETAREVVISRGLWLRRFGGDPDVVGREVRLNGESYRVAGVMPADFRFAPFWATQAEIWAPLPLADRATSGGQSLRVFARLADGVAIEAARDRVTALAADLDRLDPGSNRDVTVTPLKEVVVGNVRPMVLVAFAAVGFVMLVACVNVAHMLLARATAREQEIAVRAALGAARRRLVRQFLTESLLLSAAGALAGVGLARVTVGMLATLAGPSVPRIETLAVDGRVLALATVLAVATGLAFGLAPALRFLRDDVAAGLGQESRGSSAGRRTLRIRGLLMASEIALAVALLIGAGLTLRSFAGLRAVDPGWDPDPVLSFSVSVAGTAESAEGRRIAFYTTLIDRIRAMPGVTHASAINHVPLAGDVWTLPIRIEGRPEPAPEDVPSAAYRVVFPGYFETMDLAVRRGRGVIAGDIADAPGVVVINERLAEVNWPGANPVGKRLALGGGDWLEVVGVVENAFIYDWASPPSPELYLPFLQTRGYREDPEAHTAYMTMVARVAGDPAALEPAMRAAVRDLAPSVTVSDMLPLRDVVVRSTAEARFLMSLLGAFAGIALVLAAVGVYGVTSYDVAGRQREIGIRLAMGASPRRVLAGMIRRGMLRIAGGLAAGLAIAWSLSGLLGGILYGVEPTDPATFVLVPVVLGAVAFVATLVPSWRATRVDPVRVLGR